MVGHSWHHGGRGGYFPNLLVLRSLVYAKCRLVLHHQKQICHRGSFHIGHFEQDFTHSVFSQWRPDLAVRQTHTDQFSPKMKVELNLGAEYYSTEGTV